MPRGFTHTYKATFSCDYCGRVATVEYSAVEYEKMGYVSGYDKLPLGWVQVHYSPDLRVGDGIPTHFFDSAEHLAYWKDNQRKSVDENVRIIN